MVNLVPNPPPASTPADFNSVTWQAWFRQVQNVTANVSIGLSMPSNTFSVSGSPVLNNGLLGVTYTSQTQHTVLAAPSSGTGTPTWRTLVSSDLPGDVSSSNVLTWLSL